MKSKKINNIRSQIQDNYTDIPLLFMNPKDYDVAIIGVMDGKGKNESVAYDYEKVIDVNMKMGMSEEDAIEYFNYNQIDAYVGKHTPVFIFKLQNVKKHNKNKGDTK